MPEALGREAAKSHSAVIKRVALARPCQTRTPPPRTSAADTAPEHTLSTRPAPSSDHTSAKKLPKALPPSSWATGSKLKAASPRLIPAKRYQHPPHRGASLAASAASSKLAAGPARAAHKSPAWDRGALGESVIAAPTQEIRSAVTLPPQSRIII